MAAAVGSISYEEDLWDLQIAMSEAPTMQDRPVSPGLEDSYFECDDDLIEGDYISVADLSMETTEAVSKEVEAVTKDVEAVTKEVEEVHETEKAQRLSEDSEPEFEEEKPAQELRSTERKREYKKKFDKW